LRSGTQDKIFSGEGMAGEGSCLQASGGAESGSELTWVSTLPFASWDGNGVSRICLTLPCSPNRYQTWGDLVFACARQTFSYSVLVPEEIPIVDIVGVGLNATDTIILLPHFPAFNSKVEFLTSEILPGGQVASAVAACAKWGLKGRYVGKIGDDQAGRFQQEQMRLAGVEAHWIVAHGCQSQSAFILVDQASGERTILWKRDPGLELRPHEVDREWIVRAKLLHVDGHDCAVARTAASWARQARIPVTADIDNLYPGVEELLENVDYLVCSREFPGRLTGEANLLVSLPIMSDRYRCKVSAATLGIEGVLAWDGRRFLYCPAFDVKAVDTTGAGDIFHAGFAYAVIKGWDLTRSLEFSSAAAGLACTAPGARGGIAPVERVEEFIRTGQRHAPAFSQKQLEAFGTMS
jgi:sulfofructose kinase